MSNSSGTPIRIISGKVGGRKIITPGGRTHPMGERERIALFNSLGNDRLRNARVLDFYAGSGALGLEALSRGAASSVFIETDPAACECILNNFRALEFEARATLIRDDAKTALRSSELHHSTFRIIFCDPPYDDFVIPKDIALHLTADGVFILSHPEELGDPPEIPDLDLVSTKKYARANLSFYRRSNTDEI